MKKTLLSLAFFAIVVLSFGQSGVEKAKGAKQSDASVNHELVLPPVGTPFFLDPITGGSADPVIIWNNEEKEWFVYYTQRRANLVNDKTVAWAHGCAIGIASSKDGKAWRYRGICKGDGNLGKEETENVSWWAPDVTFEKGAYHMFVTFVPGVFEDWNHPRFIKHFTSKNGLDWKFVATLPLSSENCIDPASHNINGTYYLYYKDERKGSHTWMAKSKDLKKWDVVGEAVGDVGHEAPFVWQWEGKYYMIVDAWQKGLRIYKSNDGISNWEFQNAVSGSHPAVLLANGKTYMIYHSDHKEKSTNTKLTDLYLRELKMVNGKWE